LNHEEFKNSPAGKCVQTVEGYWTFVPNPLPPPVSYDDRLIYLLSEVDELLRELSEVGKVFPNPDFLVCNFIRREAISSSRIEGVQVSLRDLLFYEATEFREPKGQDVREVRNYIRAMEYGIARLDEIPASVKLICEIHKVLLEDEKDEQKTHGELRRTQNWIGPPGCSLDDTLYVPPSVEDMKEALGAWEKYLNSHSHQLPLIPCALMHYQFEAIRPFFKGNGRIGRLLITFFLCERGYLVQPLLCPSVFFERFKDEYCSKLLMVSKKGDWPGWIKFFLRGVAVQSKEAISCARNSLKLRSEYQEKLEMAKKVPHSAHRLVEEIFINPVISISNLSRKWNRPFNSVKRGVLKLVEIGVLEETTGRKRNKLFVASKLIRLLTASDTAGHQK
jgi:Fic family protein